MRWGIRYGRFWAVQWVIAPWVSLGIHVDLTRHVDSRGRTFGPYVDLHLLVLIVSFGWQPAYSGELERALSISRGGLPQ
jgi:hypothetical protein